MPKFSILYCFSFFNNAVFGIVGIPKYFSGVPKYFLSYIYFRDVDKIAINQQIHINIALQL